MKETTILTTLTAQQSQYLQNLKDNYDVPEATQIAITEILNNLNQLGHCPSPSMDYSGENFGAALSWGRVAISNIIDINEPINILYYKEQTQPHTWEEHTFTWFLNEGASMVSQILNGTGEWTWLGRLEHIGTVTVY